MIPRPDGRALRVTLSCLALAAGHLPALSAQNAPAVARWYAALREPRIDAGRGADVTGLTLTRDAAIFHLDRGRINLLEPIDGRTYGAVFVGEGRFEVSAPEAVETRQLERTYGKARLDEPFHAALFLFTDFTLAELSGRVEWAPLPPPADAEREAREAREYYSDGDGWASRKLLLPLVNSGPGFFYAHFSQDRGKPMIYSVDPLAFEEVSLSKRTERGKSRELVAQFHREVDYTTGRSTPQEGLDLISISYCDIETTIENDLDVVGRASITLQRTSDSHAWVPFSLYSALRVDSMRWEDGGPVPFYRAKGTSDLWVDVSGVPAEGGKLTFHYSGDMMDRPQGLWVVLGTHTTWYPVYEFGRLIPYQLTFHAPEDYVVTTVGQRVQESTSAKVKTTVWRTEPVRMLTFNVGEFDAYESVEPGAPSLEVLVNEDAHRRLGGLVADAGGLLLTQRDMAQNVALDVRNSFRFYNDVYGPTTVNDFVATEIPFSHGEAYPGLVLLAWNTFQWTTERGFDEMFRAHEVAHQWWGIAVRPSTYRDWWLAEGFAEFSGWWYAARARGSVGMYHRRLESTREEILKRRDQAAPIGLGQRVSNSDHPEDYELTIYHKSAWVLHMLRTMLTDANTGNDDAFTRVMNTFYTEHLGRAASTADFRRVVEEVVDADMGWFFDEWVYGSAIPTYTFSYKLDEQPDGQVKASVRIRQERVPDDFRMIVPILVDFGAEGTALVPVNVTGPLTEGVLPLLPREPARIVFNPDESVLAETKTERWRN